MEVPVSGMDGRAADLLLEGPAESVHIEIERLAFDGQAQIRAAQLKRRALAEAATRPVRLVIALPDTTGNRRRLAAYPDLLGHAFPAGSAAVWRAIRRGEPIGADGLLFVRARGRGRSGQRLRAEAD